MTVKMSCAALGMQETDDNSSAGADRNSDAVDIDPPWPLIRASKMA
jgi:hypothetical protein